MPDLNQKSKSLTEAIKLGKEWMQKSLDPGHDQCHAAQVEKHALNIYNEFKINAKVNNALINEVLLLLFLKRIWFNC